MHDRAPGGMPGPSRSFFASRIAGALGVAGPSSAVTGAVAPPAAHAPRTVDPHGHGRTDGAQDRPDGRRAARILVAGAEGEVELDYMGELARDLGDQGVRDRR